MGDQRLGGHTAINRPVGRRRHDDGILAATAGIARPPGHAHPQLRRHDVKLLGPQFADRMQGVTAARTGAILDVDNNLVSRQVRRQGTVIAARLFGARFTRQSGRSVRFVLAGLVGGNGLLQLLQRQLQLVRGQLLRPAAELMTHQTLDQQPELVVLGM